MEPPSKDLERRLFDARLCTPRDLRRCRRIVRRLARDVPAFDSVWIDALVQSRRLTLFQARVLESSRPESIVAGPCVLVERLGGGRSSETFLARLRQGTERSVLKLLDLPPELHESVLERLHELTRRLAGSENDAAVGPHTALLHGGKLVVVSREISGPHLGELLVRRGRFPAEVVAALARQLAFALAALERRSVVHGDVALRNVRLGADGRAVLVDAGVHAAVSPRLTIHAGLAPDRYDGIAPELIGTGREPSAASDMYALGCLLWQLLAGRPPFPTGDPLAKLMAHQTRTIENVAEWAPETPPALAELVGRLTAADPTRRPESFAALTADRSFSGSRGRDRTRLRRFGSSFQAAVRPTPPRSASTAARWVAITVLLVFVSGAVFTLADQGLRARVLASLPGPLERMFRDDAAHDAAGDAARESPKTSPTRIRELPPPDAHGVIELEDAGPYTWQRIDAVGPLAIRAAAGVRPVLIVAPEGSRIVAERVLLEGVSLHAAQPIGGDGSRTAAGPSMIVEAQEIVLRRCVLGDVADAPVGDHAAAIIYNPLEAGDGARFEAHECVFAAPGPAVQLAQGGGQIEMHNCLKLGRGTLVATSFPAAGRTRRIDLDRVTQRGGTSLVSLTTTAAGTTPGEVRVRAVDCLLDFAQPEGSLFEIVGTAVSPQALERTSLLGDGTLATPGVREAVLRDPQTERSLAIPADAVRIEGIAAVRFEFSGPPGPDLRSSRVRPETLSGPRMASRSPGIDADRLPRP
ncbi:MAG: serine/threonine protein kinase [Planctomycetes bacterium]|nr:serine/threonine protein kinase [Planctomycetota bacterium]